MKLKSALVILLVSQMPATLFAQIKKTTTKMGLPAMAAIRPSEIRSDIFDMADDHFRGREAGTLDELKVSAWLADRARSAGLIPAGDDGTYFQYFSLWRNRISSASTIQIGGHDFNLWSDVLISRVATADLSAPVLFIDPSSHSLFDSSTIQGKAVALLVSPSGINLDISVPELRYPYYIMRKYAPALVAQGAAAVIFIADSLGEKSWNHVVPEFSRGLYDIDGGRDASVGQKPPLIWVHGNQAAMLKGSGVTLKAHVAVERFEYPSVNVVAKVPGTDSALAKEYVLFSGHLDHDGIRQAVKGDSIYNGADDNASVCAAMLAIGRAFRAKPAHRSALFVWHGAEERGLLGSFWFAAHPTVEKSAIVAVLNADMIGRNNKDSAALLGVVPPHRNSEDLVRMALQANKDVNTFLLDTTWDNPGHPEFWYFRSDHLPYARAGIPAIFFSTLLHPDYHTPFDEPETIDIQKVTRMAQWMYRTGLLVANAPNRPQLDPGTDQKR